VQEKHSNTHRDDHVATNWIDRIKRYKVPLSIGAAFIIVGVSALAHYKNERLKEELIRSIGEYGQSLALIGADLTYGSVECSGIFSTDCDIDTLRFSLLGQEQMSVKSLHLGNLEGYKALKEFSEGKAVNASIAVEAKEIVLPKPLIAQMVAQNVSGLFQDKTLEKLHTLNLAFRGEFEGESSKMEHLSIDHLRIDNAIMPVEFSMEAKELSSESAETMVLESFSLSVENRAISDVTYESVKKVYDTLDAEDKTLLLKEFSLKPEDFGDRAKAAAAINAAIAKQMESDAQKIRGGVEKDLIQGIAKVLRGEAKTIRIVGENHGNLPLSEVQNLLSQSSGMDEKEARRFMEDKFTIDVELD